MKRLLTFLALALAAATSFGATLNPVQLLNPAGSAAGQAIVSTGASTAPTWGAVTASSLSPVAANTVIANFTGSTAAPVAFTMPTCSSAGRALQYSGSGIVCTSNYALTTSTLAQFAATTSAQLAGIVSDETGSGSLVFGTNPTIAGATLTGNTIFNYPTAATQLGVTWQNNGSSRWILQNDGSAETGSNAGSNLIFSARTDAGAFLSSPLVINRGSGVVTIGVLGVTGAITPNQAAGIVGTTTNNNANTGSIGEYLTGTNTGVSMTTATPTVCASLPLTAGDWDVNGTVNYSPAGTTTVSSLYAGTNTSTAITTGNNGQFQVLVLPFQTGQQQLIAAPVMRWSLASSATINLIGYSVFGTSTMTCGGFIRARRPR